MTRSVLSLRSLGPRLKSTVIGFGGGALSGSAGGYGFGDISDLQAQAILEKAFELGIRLFDTAPIYGFGESERRLGDFYRAHSSIVKECTTVTKLGVDWDSAQNVKVDNSPETVKRMLAQSLERLGLDSVDVYMIHWPDAQTPIEQTMETLANLQGQGLLKSIGVSNFTSEMIRQAEKIAPVDVVQSPFSLVGAGNTIDLLPFCAAEGKGFMSYGTLAKGILSGTATDKRTYEQSDVRARGNQTTKQYIAVKEQLEEFFSIASDLGVTGSQLAVAWVMSHDAVSTALCGSKNLDQVTEIVSGASVVLDAATQKKLNTLSEVATLNYSKA